MASITAIKTNLTRISKAKSDIIAAINEKGGTVAIGAKIEDLPACIRAIPSGGGGGEAASLKISYNSSYRTTVIYPEGYATVESEMDEIECKIGDLISIVSYTQSVSIEMGCELVYYTSANARIGTCYMFFYKITDVGAAINIT